MNVLHVNNVDLQGRRFNGFDLTTDLRPFGITGKQAVLTKLSRSPDVVSVLNGLADERLAVALRRVEQRHGMNGLLLPWGRIIAELPEFRMADVVHYHLIHNNVLSLFDLPDLFRRKPSVWTFHDPWPLTGHCIYVRECPGWTDGCTTCPFPDRPFPIVGDGARRMWAVKKAVYSEIDPDVIVASEFMLDLVKRSPLTSHFDRVHLIPFGIKSDQFLSDSAKAASRRCLHIPDDHFVLFFRSTDNEVKGLASLIEALRSHPPSRPTTLVTVEKKGLLKDLEKDFNVIELGWVENQSLYLSVFSACDLFLMPSIAEAFGLMALEAMAAGRPVVCFEGTALPAVTHAPECGIAVPMGDAKALRAAIDRMMCDSGEARERGALGREIARTEYAYDTYLRGLASLYESVLARGQ